MTEDMDIATMSAGQIYDYLKALFNGQWATWMEPHAWELAEAMLLHRAASEWPSFVVVGGALKSSPAWAQSQAALERMCAAMDKLGIEPPESVH